MSKADLGTLKELLPGIAGDSDFRDAILACDSILRRKGHDYTQGADGDWGRLKNFYANGERLGIPPMKVLAVYLNKHLDAIETFLQNGQVESEPIETRIYDAINYLLLLFKMVQFEKRVEDQRLVKPLPPSPYNTSGGGRA